MTFFVWRVQPRISDSRWWTSLSLILCGKPLVPMSLIFHQSRRIWMNLLMLTLCTMHIAMYAFFFPSWNNLSTHTASSDRNALDWIVPTWFGHGEWDCVGAVKRNCKAYSFLCVLSSNIFTPTEDLKLMSLTLCPIHPSSQRKNFLIWSHTAKWKWSSMVSYCYASCTQFFPSHLSCDYYRLMWFTIAPRVNFWLESIVNDYLEEYEREATDEPSVLEWKTRMRIEGEELQEVSRFSTLAVPLYSWWIPTSTQKSVAGGVQKSCMNAHSSAKLCSRREGESVLLIFYIWISL